MERGRSWHIQGPVSSLVCLGAGCQEVRDPVQEVGAVKSRQTSDSSKTHDVPGSGKL